MSPLPVTRTYGERYEPAMSVETQEEADEMLSKLVREQEGFGPQEVDGVPQTAEQVVKANLGYFAGYYGDEVRRRVERLFRCKHPVFGAIAESGSPSAAEAFMAGVAMARRKLGR